MAFCTKCGSKLNDSAQFCSSCGAPVVTSQAIPNPVSPNPVSPNPATGSTPVDNGQLSRKRNVKNITWIIIGAVLVMAGTIMIMSTSQAESAAKKYERQVIVNNSLGFQDAYSQSRADKYNGEVRFSKIAGTICIVIGIIGCVIGIRRQTKKYIRGQ